MSSSAMTRAKYRELGLCTECGKPAREGKTTCADCAAKHSVLDRKRLEAQKGGEPIRKRGFKPEYIYTAWRGRSIVKRGTSREVAEFFGMTENSLGNYARTGLRRKKDEVFFEREKI